MSSEYRCDHPDPCGCYAQGYADGKERAHWEVRPQRRPRHPRCRLQLRCPRVGRRVLEIWLESMATSDRQEDRALYQVFRAWVRERGVGRLLDEG